MRYFGLIGLVGLAAMCGAACGSDTGAAIPCNDAGSCPSGFYCDKNNACVPSLEGGVDSGFGGSGGSGATGGSGGSGGTGGSGGSGGSAASGGTGGSGGSGGGFCGDGIEQFVEQCDDMGESAVCDTDCTLPMCGDKLRNSSAGELCDDGPSSAVCDSDCTPVVCGDSVTNTAAGENCDQGGVDSANCDSDCTAVVCGDNHLNMLAGEECDDGGTAPGDGCTSTCKHELTGTGEDCSSAITLNAGSNTVNWTALARNYLTFVPNCLPSGVNPVGPDIVLRYVPTGSVVNVSFQKPSSTRWVAAMTASGCGSVTGYVCATDFPGSSMSATLSTTPGIPIFMYVVDTDEGSALLSNPLIVTITDN